MVKEDLRTLGVDRLFRRDVRFRRTWNSNEWIDSVQALAEDREGWAELCLRTAHPGEDAEICAGLIYGRADRSLIKKIVVIHNCGAWWSVALANPAHEALTNAEALAVS
ncbi:hypothetical protein RB195_006702 [Necator americanus]|uniref:Uncharacterized protein n=1 Tax=Necator americanus TaxID=51031 RepID=A0ABR1BTV7_NECAM